MPLLHIVRQRKFMRGIKLMAGAVSGIISLLLRMATFIVADPSIRLAHTLAATILTALVFVSRGILNSKQWEVLKKKRVVIL